MPSFRMKFLSASLCMLFASVGFAQTKQVPAQQFASLPQFSDPSISPDGQSLVVKLSCIRMDSQSPLSSFIPCQIFVRLRLCP